MPLKVKRPGWIRSSNSFTMHGLQCERAILFEMYSVYSEQEGCKHEPKKNFYSKMVKRGYIIKRKNIFFGSCLQPSYSEYKADTMHALCLIV